MASYIDRYVTLVMKTQMSALSLGLIQMTALSLGLNQMTALSWGLIRHAQLSFYSESFVNELI
jgi:hypothetical protein